MPCAGMASPKSSPSSAKRGTKIGGKSPTRKSQAGKLALAALAFFQSSFFESFLKFSCLFDVREGPKLVSTDFIPEGDDKTAPPDWR